MHNGGEAALTDALNTGTPTLYIGFSALVAVLLLTDFALPKTPGNQRVSPLSLIPI